MDSLTFARYSLRHVGFWFGIIWAVVLGVLLCGDIFETIRRSGGHPHFLHVLSLASLKIPIHTDHFLPFITFVAARLSLWRLQKRRELIALSSIGVSSFYWARLWCVVTLILGLVHLCVLQPTSAALQNTWSDCEAQWMQQRSNYRFAVVTSGLWLRESNASGYRIIQAQQISKGTLNKLKIYEWDHNNRFSLYLEADEASLTNNAWHLINVKTVHSSGESQNHDRYQLETNLTWNNVMSSQIDPRSLSIWRIGEWLPLLEQVGLSTHPYLMYWHRHIAQVGLTAALLLLALAISSMSLIWMASGLVIYFVHDIVQALGQAEHIPMILSVWCVPLVVLLMSVSWLMHKEEKL